MRTINIKGKEYVMVVDRVKEFHILHPFGEITTEIVDSGPSRVSVKATVKVPQLLKKTASTVVTEELMTRIFTGHSQAEWGKGMMGDVALEIAETSAIGRALGFANIGLLDGIASADEIRKVSKRQSYNDKNKKSFENGDDPLEEDGSGGDEHSRDNDEI